MDRKRARNLIESFDFAGLFADELMWNRLRTSVLIEVEGKDLLLQSVAEKKQVQVLLCPPEEDGSLPPYPLRQKIERQVTKQVREHLVIYTNAARTAQVWQWVAREPGRPTSYREIVWQQGQSADLLLEKLGLIAFRLEDDDTLLTVLDVAVKLRDAFDRDKLTKRFYDDFKLERDAFLKFIKGMPGDAAGWYTSVMINRLMFVYFLQRKRLANNEGFLDDKHDYLRHHLALTQRQLSKNCFYRDFLCPLFFQGFAQSHRRDEVRARFGDIPFLNGGLFNRHPLEEKYGAEIQIADSAFERLFDYFDKWDWHLDDRPLQRTEAQMRVEGLRGEINPDVLGYIFEKYINQKQLGAYYTKEDITGYICRNTIIPGLLDKVRARCGAAVFDAAAWLLLQQDPDRYIWPALRHGAGQVLPADIAAGLDPEQPDLIEKRKPWNRRAPETYALPTEIWREVIARRDRYAEVRAKLATGLVRETNDLITYNLNAEQFAQDLIARSEDPAVVRAVWRTLTGVVPDVGSSQREFEYGFSVLDPTCGSGAFLFAALNVLEPLYRAGLTRMRAFVLQADLDGERQKYPDFRRTLADVDRRPNEGYFICKSVIVNNLYGVDIVEEAVEIAKLRLFLKLVAQLDDKRHIEPLPDIDFNIRAGNALVGFASYEEVKKAVTQETTGQGKMLFDDAMTLIEQDAHVAERAYLRFRQQQVALGGEITIEDKQGLRDQLTALEERLNWYLAREYGIDPTRSERVEKWKASHKPFHWFVDFYGIVAQGGFDAVIGNPPYLPLKDLREYDVRKFICLPCGNLYAVMIERFLGLAGKVDRVGVIVPVSSVSTDGYATLQGILKCCRLYASSYDDRPSRLFDGLEHIRLSILVTAGKSDVTQYATRYHKWSARERPHLFQNLQYQRSDLQPVPNTLAKLCSSIESDILSKLLANARLAAKLQRQTRHILYYSRKVGYFLQVVTFVPKVRDGAGAVRKPSEFKTLCFDSKRERDVAACLLNSSLFYWFLTLASDCRHVNAREVEGMPFPLVLTGASALEAPASLVAALMRSLRKNADIKQMRFKHDTLEIECLIPKRSHSELVAIDDYICRMFGLSLVERDFISAYDIKYRLGADIDQSDE
jgi:hypothetical protein